MTVGQLKVAVGWEQILNLSASDPRWLSYLNQFLERVSHMGLWDRYVQPYQICVDRQACITWPRPILTIEAMDICNRPIPIRNGWFEYLPNGPGRQTIRGCSIPNLIDRGRGYAMFDDLTVASVIRLYPRFTADIGKSVLIRGYDSNGQWVMTSGGTTEGEILTLKTPYVDSTTIWMKQVFRQVIKDDTRGPVTAFSYDASLPVPPASPGPSDTPLTPLAVWEPNETVPDYRRSFIPALANLQRCCNGNTNNSTNCDKTTVTVMAKLQHIPVSNDLDVLSVSNLGALKLGMLSIMLEERHDYDGARVAMFGTFDQIRKRFVGGAVPCMEDDLDDFQGAGTTSILRLESSQTDRATVINMI